jgi:hypothetical protein
MLFLGWPLVAGLSAGTFLAGFLAVNTIQSGPLSIESKYDDVFSALARSKMTYQSLAGLKSKKDFTQLFLRCQAPETLSMREFMGSYDGYLLNLGVCAPLSKFISNRLFGPGEWAGKELGLTDGINLFLRKSLKPINLIGNCNISRSSDAPNHLMKAKRFTCSVEQSVLDGQYAIRLNYSPFNKLDVIAWGMQDELRMINKDLLIGCGGLALSGGIRNFAPFFLVRKK